MSGGTPMLVVGSHASPYVRKVLVALDRVGVRYAIDPIVPYLGNDDFTRISPLRRVPVLIDGDVTLCDSTVICEYLADRFPDAGLLPATPADRARAQWVEEYCDSRMGDVIVWKLFFQRVIGPGVWRQPTDVAVVDDAVNVQLPAIMDWVEDQAPAAGFLFGDRPSIADIALGAFMRTAALARWAPDADRWPRGAAWIDRVLTLPSFAALVPLEQVVVSTPPAGVRDALAAAGAVISEVTYGGSAPRHGVLPSGAFASTTIEKG